MHGHVARTFNNKSATSRENTDGCPHHHHHHHDGGAGRQRTCRPLIRGPPRVSIRMLPSHSISITVRSHQQSTTDPRLCCKHGRQRAGPTCSPGVGSSAVRGCSSIQSCPRPQACVLESLAQAPFIRRHNHNQYASPKPHP